MKTLAIMIAVAVLLGCSQAEAYLPAPTSPYTVTFDDIPPGGDLSYYESEHGLALWGGWYVVDHMGSGWGQPRSGLNVLMWDWNPSWAAGFSFGLDPTDYPDSSFLPYNVRSVSAYFSTEPGIVLRMTGYAKDGNEVASALIGATGESWTNRYVEITSEPEEIAFVHISGVTSQDDRYHFCLDDLTIVPVPEPSSLLALGSGVLALAGLALRRRRK